MGATLARCPPASSWTLARTATRERRPSTDDRCAEAGVEFVRQRPGRRFPRGRATGPVAWNGKARRVRFRSYRNTIRPVLAERVVATSAAHHRRRATTTGSSERQLGHDPSSGSKTSCELLGRRHGGALLAAAPIRVPLRSRATALLLRPTRPSCMDIAADAFAGALMRSGRRLEFLTASARFSPAGRSPAEHLLDSAPIGRSHHEPSSTPSRNPCQIHDSSTTCCFGSKVLKPLPYRHPSSGTRALLAPFARFSSATYCGPFCHPTSLSERGEDRRPRRQPVRGDRRRYLRPLGTAAAPVRRRGSWRVSG